jgi:hypothetical protein
LNEYGILQLPGSMTPENREPLGSKKKLWFRDPSAAVPRVLFKYNRPNTGEDWSEKIASELARLLGLPHAAVELASFADERGAALVDFTDNERFALVHGNEILESLDSSYPKQRRYGSKSHTVASVLSALEHFHVGLPHAPAALPGAVRDAFGAFTGYLLLDAWIGNTDRHHENWGVLRQRDQPSQTLVLAPTFDHASSLARELGDGRRTDKGNPKQGTPVERYAKRAVSAFYVSDGSGRQLTTWEAFAEAAARRPKAAKDWLRRLSAISEHTVKAVVEAVPSSRMSDTAKAFACALLEQNAKLVGAR